MIAAPLLRLYFHDCFAQGCDASILLKSTDLNRAEIDDQGGKSSSLSRFDFIDIIKADLETACPRTVSCADILGAVAVAAVRAAGGPLIQLPYGRNDGMESFAAMASTNMPAFFLRVDGLLQNFLNVGLNQTDLVALSGAHTIGEARCVNFQDRFAVGDSKPFEDPIYRETLRTFCTGGGNKKVLLDTFSGTIFDNGYFRTLVEGHGVFTSDNELFQDPRTKDLVIQYSQDQNAFFAQFAESFRKMGRINVLTGTQGQIRQKCSIRNKVAESFHVGKIDFNPASDMLCRPPEVARQCAP